MSGKRPTDHMEPSAKKRGSERQLTKDDESEDEEQAVDPRSFARASEDVIKQRKIVKARRSSDKANPFAGIQLAATTVPPPAPAANPFTGVSLFGAAGTPASTPVATSKPEAAPAAVEPKPAATGAPAQQASGTVSSEQPEDKTEEGSGAATGDQPKTDVKLSGGFGTFGGGAASGVAFCGSGFGSASGGFGSLAGGSSGGAFSFGAASAAAATSSIFAFSTTATPSFGFAAASNAATRDAMPAAPTASTSGAAAGSSLFGATTATGTPIFGAVQPAATRVALPGEQAVTTGEEGERTVFSGEGALFEFDASKQWRERGRGEMRVNTAPSGQGRLVMRQKGNLRLLMNANLWGEMQVSKMEGGKGVTFACVNAAAAGEEAGGGKEDGEAPAAAAGTGAGEVKLATFALRIKLPEVLDAFVAAVNAHKAGGRKEAACDP